MSILQYSTDLAGQTAVHPRLVRIICDDDLSTITSLNWLQQIIIEGYLNPTFYETDIFFIGYGADSSSVGIFTAIIDGTDITLVSSYAEGTLTSFPNVLSTGTLNLTAIPNAGNYTITISNRSMSQSTTFSIGDPGQSTASILTSKVIADVGANLISFDVTVTAAALPSSSVTLYQSSGTKQYKIRSLQINAPGTNFSGGGGDRLMAIADNTNVYSLIPAATLQALTNSVWGSTALPLPALVPVNTSIAAGQSLIARYSGGTTDYSAGSIVISGILERVA